MTSDYIRRLTRRKRTRTDAVFTVTTKDGWTIRIKPMAITDRRIQGSKQRAIREIMGKVVANVGARSTVGDLVKGVISGDLAKEMAAACKPVHPISRVEIRKSEVLLSPALPPEETVPTPPSSEAVPAEEELPREEPREEAETLPEADSPVGE